MGERKRLFLLILIMTTVSWVVAGSTIYILYGTAFDEQRERLVETAQSQARLIEAVARFDVAHQQKWHPGVWVPAEATLSQVIDAHKHYRGFGETGEFTLAHRQGDNIIFLLRHRHYDLGKPKPVLFNSTLAEPMRRALSGLSGTVIGPDYRGEKVLAAHEPVAELDWGIVAKIDLAEVRLPFLKAAITANCAALLVVIIGAALFLRVSNPLIRRLEEHAGELTTANEQLRFEIGERKRAEKVSQKAHAELERRVEERTADLVNANRQLMQEIEERKRVDEALRESETRFRELADLLPQSVFELDLKGNFTYSNRCGFEAFGYTREDLEKGINALQLYIPEERQRVKQNIMKRLTGEEFDDHEYTGLKKDGSIFPILVYSSPIIRDGKRLGVRGIVLDITERKQVEEALEKLNLELEERVEQRTAEISRTNAVLKREIAERERAEQALRESEERYRTVLEANPDPVVVYDMEGRITYLNPAFTNTFGWTLEERLGKKMDVFVPEDSWPETKMMIDRALAEKTFSGLETHRLTKQGTIIPVSVSAAIYRDRDGNPVGSVVNLRDISEQKVMEAQLQHVQKMEAVGTLAGGIAHEFNNLLQAVQGYAELLLLRRKQEEPTCKELQEIVRSAKRGGELSQQLLTFSRKIESKLRPVDINLEAKRAVKLLSRTIPRMIEIELHLGEGLETVNADPAQIEQILVNLAVNAKDAMPEGGKLTIETETSILDEEYCRRHTGARPGQYTVLVVSDTGHGMDKETLERIFEPFFTTKGLGEGTGLGLAMIYGIVRNHGGHITCSSEPGAGTTFKLYFPVVEHEVQFEKETESELPEGGTETILLVDDEDFILDLGKEILLAFGYTVLTAPDGKTALELYRNEQGQIDLVILDMIMPRMSGRQCLEELIRINPKAKVVICSGYSHIGHMKETLKAGAIGFIGKPYEMKQLLQVVRKALEQD